MLGQKAVAVLVVAVVVKIVVAAVTVVSVDRAKIVVTLAVSNVTCACTSTFPSHAVLNFRSELISLQF
jgi:hypothetical protein